MAQYHPVTRGLVKHPGDWKYSSYNWMNGIENILIEMDNIELQIMGRDSYSKLWAICPDTNPITWLE